MTPNIALDPALESLLAFWAEAGVDCAVEDAPTDKLRRREPAPRPEPVAAVAPSTPAAGRGGNQLSEAVAEARRLAAAAPDAAALQAAAESFAPAGVKPAGARRAVLLRGEASADVVVIGGAPGGDEELSGTAFSGAEGRLLDRILAAAGLTGRALLVHAVLWRPPGDRPPTVEEAAVCRPFLDRAVALARPKAILVLGDAPARLLLGREEGVLNLRREALTWSPHGSAHTLPVHVTFGLGLLLKQPQAKKRAWEDVLTLMERVATDRAAP